MLVLFPMSWLLDPLGVCIYTTTWLCSYCSGLDLFNMHIFGYVPNPMQWLACVLASVFHALVFDFAMFEVVLYVTSFMELKRSVVLCGRCVVAFSL